MCPMDTMPRQWLEKLWNTINACSILLTLDIIFTKENSKEKNVFFSVEILIPYFWMIAELNSYNNVSPKIQAGHKNLNLNRNSNI